MRVFFFLVIVLLGGIDLIGQCRWELVENGDFLEVYDNGFLKYNLNACSMTWRHLRGDDYMISDCCDNEWECDIDMICVPSFSDTGLLFDYLKGLRDSCLMNDVIDPPDMWSRGIVMNHIRREVGVGSYTIGSGAVNVYVRNSGLVDVVVNGEVVSPNGVWQCGYHIDLVNNVEDYCDEVSWVVPVGGEVWYQVFYPSN